MKDWALVLGASGGIGAACVKSLAKKGINIYGVYLRKPQSHIEKLKKDLSKYKVDIIFKKANASNEIAKEAIIKELKNLGDIRIKLFIHSNAFGTLKKMISKDQNNLLQKKNIEMTLDVMCNNLIYWSQDLWKNKLLTSGSHIIGMTSAGGRKNWENYGAISLAKSAMESAIRQLSLELAPYNIAVNAIQAGVTDTPALRKIPGANKMMESALKNNPHKRITMPADVGKFVSLLASYNSSWMTGNIIKVDGGEDITS